jgi:peroxiredoxin
MLTPPSFEGGIGMRYTCRRTNSVSTCVALAASIASMLAVASASADPGAPAASQPAAVKAEAPTYDFGEVWAGEKVEHTFKLVNTGGAPIAIERVRSSCGCTTTKDYDKTIAPNAEWELTATFDTKGLHDKTRKTITVYSKSFPDGSLRFTFEGTIKTRYNAEPRLFGFGRLQEDEAQTQTVIITSTIDDPLILRNARTDSETLFVDLREVEKGKRYEVVLATVPMLKAGTLRGKIEIDTNIPAEPTIELWATGVVMPRVSLQPAEMRIPTKRDRDYRRPLTVRNDGDSAVQVTDVKASNPNIKTELKAVIEGRLYQVWVTIPKNVPIASAGELVMINTDDPEFGVLRAPIRSGAVRARRTTPQRPPRRPVMELIGKEAPAFALTSTSGKPVSNESLHGSVAVLDFFSPACGFCKKQVPRVEALRKTYEAKGVRFVNVSQQMGKKEYTQEEIEKVLDQWEVAAELAIDADKTVGRAFHVTGYPTMVIVDKSGKVAAVNIGNKADLETRLRKQLDALTNGKPVPALTSGG